MFYLLLFMACLALRLFSRVQAACHDYNTVPAFSTGLYAPCTQAYHHEHSIQFDDRGVLTVSDPLGHALFMTQSSAAAASACWDCTFQLALLPGGQLQIANGDTVVWQAFDATLPYPGRPTTDLWTLEAGSPPLAPLRISYNHTFTMWSSTNGLVMATRQAAGEPVDALQVNQYVQAAQAFLLKQIDGSLCVYDGTYPSAAKHRACIPDTKKQFRPPNMP
jgi:hypothetical protein